MTTHKDLLVANAGNSKVFSVFRNYQWYTFIVNNMSIKMFIG